MMAIHINKLVQAWTSSASRSAINCSYILLLLCVAVSHFGIFARAAATEECWVAQRLESEVKNVNPFKGLIIYREKQFDKVRPTPESGAMSLEYIEIPYSRIVQDKGLYNWGALDTQLDIVASQARQAVLRFWSVYPGEPSSGVPDYIRHSQGYNDAWVYVDSEGVQVNYDDWSSQLWKDFVMDFFRTFAERYDGDGRIAFLQV